MSAVRRVLLSNEVQREIVSCEDINETFQLLEAAERFAVREGRVATLQEAQEEMRAMKGNHVSGER